jgi:GntR family transcriptional regulator
MSPQWDDSVPIYRQLRDRVVAMILEGHLKEGDPLPSVRSVAADYRLNPLTVLKGYQQLVDENLVEKRRGRGMYVSQGARRSLMKDERQRFLEEEWPRVHATIVRLGLSATELLDRPAPPSTSTLGSSPGSPSASSASPSTSNPATSPPDEGSWKGEPEADLNDGEPPRP